MAKTQKVDPAIAKQRKQKIILGVIGAMFLLLAVLQGPKLLKQLSGGSATPAASAPADATVGTPTGTVTPVAALAGAVLPAAAAADPTQGKLISFSLFTTKDPFVPQVNDKPATVATAPAVTGTTPPTAAGTGTSAAGSPTAGDAGTTVAPPEVPELTDATLVINGSAEYLKADATFPAGDPVFALVSLKPKTVKIGVAGGAFTGGKRLVLKLGKSITLVNTATGARYQIMLVYTGTTPEKVESFTAGSAGADSSGKATTKPSAADASAPSSK